MKKLLSLLLACICCLAPCAALADVSFAGSVVSGGAVSVRVERGPVFTQIAVRDNGKGIARERQGAVFARFYREPEVHDSEGAGLGLYLTRGIIERQGGFVEVSSEPERGSVFTINLPN